MLSEIGAVRKIIDAMEYPTWLVGPGGTIDVINSAALSTLGYRYGDDVLGRNSHLTFHHSHVDGSAYDESDCPLLTPRDSGGWGARPAVEWLIRRDGSTFPVTWATRAVELDGESMVVLSIGDATPSVGAAAIPHRSLDSTHRGRVELFRRVSSYMAANARDPDVTPMSTARIHNMSIRMLQNIFAESGDSPARFLRRCRVKAAAQSLRDGHRPADACVLAGFGDDSTFRRAFRESYGVVPSEYHAQRGTGATVAADS